jgi:hypothetical protein
MDPEQRIKIMLEQFNFYYQNDPALKQLLGADAASLTVDEKLEILKAYIEGGGVKGLLNDEELEALEVDP